ncbi:MAG: SDR family oxidoreductase [Rhodospirillales bacterium]|jgi:NAD(P)-dependent dehydrogenase (short-subunit alcohol dehydrogenase family)|nr:SDR family oxidoreductase [Rhodospirillales bacterium]
MRTVFITGSNRGLGLEFVKQYERNGFKVIAACRNPKLADSLNSIKGNIEVTKLDINSGNDFENISAAYKNENIDILINNAGIIGLNKKIIGEINYEDWKNVFQTNVLGPTMMVERLLSQIARSEKKLIVSVSSKLGSISENSSGGQYAYRASKAALNAVNKSLSVDLIDKGITTIVISPGWVKTDMGGQNADITIQDSVTQMCQVIERVDINDTGKFFNFDGKIIKW